MYLRDSYETAYFSKGKGAKLQGLKIFRSMVASCRTEQICRVVL